MSIIIRETNIIGTLGRCWAVKQSARVFLYPGLLSFGRTRRWAGVGGGSHASPLIFLGGPTNIWPRAREIFSPAAPRGSAPRGKAPARRRKGAGGASALPRYLRPPPPRSVIHSFVPFNLSLLRRIHPLSAPAESNKYLVPPATID
jgi:hypothetical protein